MAGSRQSKEPCKKEACDIQACLTKNNFNPQRSTKEHFEVTPQTTKSTEAAIDEMTIMCFRAETITMLQALSQFLEQGLVQGRKIVPP